MVDLIEPQQAEQIITGKFEVTPTFSWCSPELRAAPNCFLRSNLFAAIAGKNRRYLKGEPIRNSGHITIKYTGEQLSQTDLDCYLEILDLSRAGGREFGNVTTILNQLLHKLGRSTGGKDIKWVKKVIDRLYNASIKIESANGKSDYEGRLINEIGRVENKYLLGINKNLGKLFTNGYCRLNPSERNHLIGKPLAQWLYGFYKSNNLDLQYLYSVDSLRELSGSTNKNLAGFKQKLKEALCELCYTTGWATLIINNEYQKDLVLVVKKEECFKELFPEIRKIVVAIHGNPKMKKENEILLWRSMLSLHVAFGRILPPIVVPKGS